MFGSRLMGNARFLVSDNDYKAFEKFDGIEPYKFYISFIDTYDTSALQSELGKGSTVWVSIPCEALAIEKKRVVKPE